MLRWSKSYQKEANELFDQVRQIDERRFLDSLDRQCRQRLDAFQEGVRRYHAHPYHRLEKVRPHLWQDGSSRLVDYSEPNEGPVVLVVPSLVNKSYILDLKEGRSLMQGLADRGLNPFMLDWGTPQEGDLELGLEDYILGRLKNAIDVLARQTCKPVHLIGYCMGGTMATGFSALAPEHVASLSLLATPWDFDQGRLAEMKLLETARPVLNDVMDRCGALPAASLQSIFAMMNPFAAIDKYRDFATIDPESERAEMFVAIEDWNNDGISLSTKVARACLFDWYVDNQPMKGNWEMAGEYIDPARIEAPVSLFSAKRDRIVEPDSSYGLCSHINGASLFNLDCGHVGMVCGEKAPDVLYSPLAKWILQTDRREF